MVRSKGTGGGAALARKIHRLRDAVEGLPHSDLDDLDADDHVQYHNDLRGDARYYLRSLFLAVSAGAGDAGSPVLLAASGRLSPSIVPLTENGQTAETDTGKSLRPDGMGGQEWAVLPGSGDVVSPGGETSGRMAMFSGSKAIAETAFTATAVQGAIDHAAITTGNPHNLDAGDVSAEPAGSISTHAALPNAHHAEVHTIVSHDTSATGAQVTSLVDSSDVDGLHKHAIADAHIADTSGSPHGIGATIATHAGDANAHHPQVHTIASHDTSATGAQVTSLVDSSDVDGLHKHAIADAHIADMNNPHDVDAADTGAATLTPTPADDELILGDGSAANVRGGSIRLNEFASVGVVGDPATLVEDDGGGNVRINAHTAHFKLTNSLLAKLVRVEVPLISAIPVPLNTQKWIGVDYNGGTPLAIVTDNDTDFNLLTTQPLAAVARDSIGIHPVPIVIPITEFSTLSAARLYATDLIRRDEGLIIDVAGAPAEQFQMTAGSMFVLYLRQIYPALDTSTAGTFNIYTGSTGAFSNPVALADYPPDQYNNGTATPATLTNNRWTNIWWYLDVATGAVSGFLGTSNTNDLGVAGAENVPNDLPPNLRSAPLLGRFLVLKDTPASTISESAFDTSFQGEGVTAHGSLSGLAASPDAGHTQLQTRSEKAAALGYASLDSSLVLVQPAKVIRTTTGPTSLAVGAWGEGQALVRSGSTAIGADITSAIPLGHRRRSTTPTITSSFGFFELDVDVKTINAAFLVWGTGEYVAQKTFTCRFDAHCSVSPSSFDTIVDMHIIVNTVDLIAKAQVYVDTFDSTAATMSCTGVVDLVNTDTVRLYLFTDGSNAQVIADTLTLTATPLETT